jgi:hypothetical protein
MAVRAGKPAEIRALAWASAGNEECHIRLLRMYRRNTKNHKPRHEWRAHRKGFHAGTSRKPVAPTQGKNPGHH